MRRSIYILLTVIACVSAWNDDDLEVFDVVEEVNQNFYELLGVTQEATPAEIKSAFKKLTLKLHPDKNDAPDADVQFRNLVSVHNVLKDPGKREKYNDVLKNGLPNWRSAMYYYRHVRKIGLMEGSIIVFIIITLGQYMCSWAAYVERKYTAEQVLSSRWKKTSKTKAGFDAGLAEIIAHLPRPSMKDTLPFQIPKLIWWTILAVPRAIERHKEQKKQQEENERRQKKRDEEDKLRAEREAAMAEAAKGARKRRAFVPPVRDHCLLDAADEPEDSGPVVVPVAQKPAQPIITGGLWTDDDLAELVRLVKKHPPGSAERWERIAEVMGRSVPEVTHMAAKMKDNCYKLPGHEEVEPVVEVPKKVKTRKAEETPAGNWSQTQQKALEAALAKHPKGGAGDRWQKISNSVPGKTKEECMARCKYLSDMVRKQKQKEEEELNKAQNEDMQNNTETSDNV